MIKNNTYILISASIIILLLIIYLPSLQYDFSFLKYKHIGEWKSEVSNLKIGKVTNNSYGYLYQPSLEKNRIIVTWLGDTTINSEISTDCFAMYRLVGYDSSLIKVNNDELTIAPIKEGRTNIYVEKYFAIDSSGFSIVDSFFVDIKKNDADYIFHVSK